MQNIILLLQTQALIELAKTALSVDLNTLFNSRQLPHLFGVGFGATPELLTAA